LALARTFPITPSRTNWNKAELTTGNPAFGDWNIYPNAIILLRHEFGQIYFHLDFEGIFTLPDTAETHDFQQSICKRERINDGRHFGALLEKPCHMNVMFDRDPQGEFSKCLVCSIDPQCTANRLVSSSPAGSYVQSHLSFNA
jgi:hypothetical protein